MLKNSFFLLGETLCKVFAKCWMTLKWHSQERFPGLQQVLSWADTLNNEAFYFYLCGFSNFKILNPSASLQSLEVLLVRKRNDFCAGVTQCSWGPVCRISLLKDNVPHTFKQEQIRRALTDWVNALPHSSALIKHLTNHFNASICGKFYLWIIHFWHRVRLGQCSKRQRVLSLQQSQCKLSVH